MTTSSAPRGRGRSSVSSTMPTGETTASSTRLTAEQRADAIRLGKGNASEGIRVALDMLPLLERLIDAFEQGHFPRKASSIREIEALVSAYRQRTGGPLEQNQPPRAK